MMYDQYNNHGGDGIGWLFMFIMMALLFLGVVFVLRYLSHMNGSTSKESTALEILNSRYAKGEIDKKEFDEKRNDLKA